MNAASPTIAIVAPGGYDSDPTRLERATRYFEQRGRRVVIALDPSARNGRFAGTEAERLAHLARVVGDPTIDSVIALRGGYGATRLLPSIDFDAMARSGQRFIGHSDFTVVHLALLATTGAISFAGPMASYDFGGDAVDPFTAERFWEAVDASRVEFGFDTDSSDLHARGVLWGGNLAMVASLIGTPWMPRVEGGVLFLEDVNERPFRVERMLLQLLQAGVLETQRAVLLGDFSGQPVAYDNGYGVDDAIAYLRTQTRTPIVTGLPFGHCPRKATLAVGVPAEIDVSDGRCRVRQQWKIRTA